MAWKQQDNTQKNWADTTPIETTWKLSQGVSITYQQLDSQVTDLVSNGNWSATFITWDGSGSQTGSTLQWDSIAILGGWTDITNSTTQPNWS